MSAERLSLGRKGLYGLGAVALTMQGPMLGFYLLPFYTDVVLLSPGLAGFAKMLGAIWDGVDDPIVGHISDRTRTRFGRRRPYLLGAALPMGLAFGLVWSPPGAMAAVGKFFYLLLALCMLDVFLTLYLMPYLALGAELSSDYHERTELTAARAFFEIVGVFLGMVPCLAIQRLAGGTSGYATVGLTTGGVVAFVALVAAAGVSEPPIPSRATDSDRASLRGLARGLWSTLENPAFRVVLVTFCLFLLGSGLNLALLPYAFRHWLEIPDQIPAAIGINLVASAISLPFWTWLSKRIGKDRALNLCIFWEGMILVASPLLLARGMSGARLWCVMFLWGLNAGLGPLAFSMVADIVDQDDLLTGSRREGTYFGVGMMATKIAGGLAAGLAGLGLDAAGYAPNQVQSPATVFSIELLYGPVPAIFLFAAFFVFRGFPLTRERHAEVRAALAARGTGAEP